MTNTFQRGTDCLTNFIHAPVKRTSMKQVVVTNRGKVRHFYSVARCNIQVINLEQQNIAKSFQQKLVRSKRIIQESDETREKINRNRRIHRQPEKNREIAEDVIGKMKTRNTKDEDDSKIEWCEQKDQNHSVILTAKFYANAKKKLTRFGEEQIKKNYGQYKEDIKTEKNEQKDINRNRRVSSTGKFYASEKEITKRATVAASRIETHCRDKSRIDDFKTEFEQKDVNGIQIHGRDNKRKASSFKSNCNQKDNIGNPGRSRESTQPIIPVFDIHRMTISALHRETDTYKQRLTDKLQQNYQSKSSESIQSKTPEFDIHREAGSAAHRAIANNMNSQKKYRSKSRGSIQSIIHDFDARRRAISASHGAVKERWRRNGYAVLAPNYLKEMQEKLTEVQYLRSKQSLWDAM